MKPLWSIENQTNLRALIIQDLKDLGIKISKKRTKSITKLPSTSDDVGKVFANYLCFLSCVPVEDCGHVPRFLVDAVSFLEPHLDTEGLFRKSGVVSRQKELKELIDSGGSLINSQPPDVCGLVKLFFRELPEPLLTTRYLDTFLKCYQLCSLKNAAHAMLLVCLLMPLEHLSTLRFTMKFLAKVAGASSKNKMDAGNLAVILGPNIMHMNNHLKSDKDKINANDERLLHTQTAIVEFLIRSADHIGMVSRSLAERVELMGECFPSEDELEKSSDTFQDPTPSLKMKKKKRSSSLQGFVTSLAQTLAKWRNGSKASQSVIQADNLSVLSNDSAIALSQSDMPTVTPKLRKRKASNDILAFSATKRKAILKGMPQHSALASAPFTPASASKSARVLGHQIPMSDVSKVEIVDDNTTPVKFVDTTTEKRSMPCKKLGMFSPGSGKKLRINSSSSSLIVAKQKKKRSLLRRFSGGRSNQDSPKVTTIQIGYRLASPSGNKPDCENKKTGRSPFGKRKKSLDKQSFTESPIPALLLSSLNAGINDTVFQSPDYILSKPPIGDLPKRQISSKTILTLPSTMTIPSKVSLADISPRIMHKQSSKSSNSATEKATVICNPSALDITMDIDTTIDSSVCVKTHESTIILPPPKQFADMSQVKTDDMSDSDESETGFSTISGGTAIYVPSGAALTLPRNTDTSQSLLTISMDNVNSNSKIAEPTESIYMDMTKCSNRKFVSADNLAKRECANIVSRSQSVYEGRGRRQAKIPNLQLSTDTARLLSRAGYMSEGNVNGICSSEELHICKDDKLSIVANQKAGHVPIIKRASMRVRVHDSVHDLHDGKVAATVKQYTNSDKRDAMEIKERHTSPFRFPRSTTRTRGISPVRIPTVFAKNDKEAAKFREMAMKAVKANAKGRAQIPISTQLHGVGTSDSGVQSLEREGFSLRRKPSIFKKDADKREKCKSTIHIDINMKKSTDFDQKSEIHIDCPHKEACRETSHVVNTSVTGVELDNGQNSPVNLLDKCFVDEEDMDVATTPIYKTKSVDSGLADESLIGGKDSNESTNDPRQNVAIDPTNSPQSIQQLYDLNESLKQTIKDVCTPLSEKLQRQYEDLDNHKSPLRDSNRLEHHGSTVKTPTMKPPLISTPFTERIVLRTSGGNTPRNVIQSSSVNHTPTKKVSAHYHSSGKPVKRLASPGSPRSKSSRHFSHYHHHNGSRINSSPGLAIVPIRQHITDDLEHF